MKRSEAFPSKFVSKDDVEIPVIWTIAGVQKVEMDDDGGGKKAPPVVSFVEENAKPLILNNSNWMTLEDLYGDDSDNWTGKKIELYKDASVMFGGKRVGGVRVRKPGNQAPAKTVTDLKELRAKLKGAGIELRKIMGDELLTPEGLAQVYAEHEALLAAHELN